MCRRFIPPWTRRDCSLKHVPPFHPSMDQERLLPQTCATIPSLHGPGGTAPSNMCRHSTPPWTRRDCSLKHVPPFHPSIDQQGLLPQTCYAIPPLHGPGRIAPSNMLRHSTPPWTRRDCSLKHVTPSHSSIDQEGLLTQTCAVIPPLHGPGGIAPSNMCRHSIPPLTSKDCSRKHVLPSQSSMDQEGLLPQTCYAIPPLHGPGGIAPSNMLRHSTHPWTRRGYSLKQVTPFHPSMYQEGLLSQHVTPFYSSMVRKDCSLKHVAPLHPSMDYRHSTPPWIRKDCSLKHAPPFYPSMNQERLIAPSNIYRRSTPPWTRKDCSLKHAPPSPLNEPGETDYSLKHVPPFHPCMNQEGLMRQTCTAIPSPHYIMHVYKTFNALYGA